MGWLEQAAAWLDDALTPGRWVTLKNGKRIKVDDGGRIVLGLPERFHGTHIRDLSKLSHDEREIEGIDCSDVGHCHTCHKTFRTKDEAVAALLQANPQLQELRDSEFGAYDLEFLKWQRGGRRGPKPRTQITDGRLDAINEHFELRGAARVASFAEAIYWAVPSSRRWEDLEGERLQALSEAAGFEVQPPAETLQAEAGRMSEDECRADVDRRLGALFDRAKSGRLEGRSSADLEEREPGADDDAGDAGAEKDDAPF